MENIEIEIKLKIDQDKFTFCKQFLEEKADYLGTSKQIDQYYSAPHRDFLEPDYPYEWLRLRESDGHTILNYKHWYPENSDSSTHCEEFETIVSSSDSIEAIFKALQIDLLIRVDKVREKYMLNEEFEIVLDYIDELGHFIEIEYKGSECSIEQAQKKLTLVVKFMGLDLTARDNRGYPYLMLEKVGKLNK